MSFMAQAYSSPTGRADAAPPARGGLTRPGNLPPGGAVEIGMRQPTVLRPLAGLLLAAVVVLLAACAEPDAGDGGAAFGGAGPTTTAETLPTAPPTPSTEPGSTGGSQVTATGTVQAGVEPGCLLLHADQGTVYLLVGGDRRQLRAGGRIQVTGRVVPDLLSTCQQGEPLRVGSVRPAP
jgi:hypothetical protein